MPLPTFDLAAADARIEAELALAASSDRPSIRAHAPGAAAPEAAPVVELPPGWEDALAEVLDQARPAGASMRDWSRVARAVWSFAGTHAATLYAAGWTFDEVFGAPHAWCAHRGVLWLDQGLREARCVEITPDRIRWQAANGATLTKWREGRMPGVRVGGAS